MGSGVPAIGYAMEWRVGAEIWLILGDDELGGEVVAPMGGRDIAAIGDEGEQVFGQGGEGFTVAVDEDGQRDGVAIFGGVGGPALAVDPFEAACLLSGGKIEREDVQDCFAGTVIDGTQLHEGLIVRPIDTDNFATDGVEARGDRGTLAGLDADRVSGGGGEAGEDGNACEDWRVSHGLVQNFTRYLSLIDRTVIGVDVSASVQLASMSHSCDSMVNQFRLTSR